MEDRFRFIPRQETPLPEEFGYDGQWLIPFPIFVYRPQDQRIKDATSPRSIAQIQLSNDTICVRFDIGQLAGAFQMTEEEIFKANDDGLILLVNVQRGITDAGLPDTRYIFNIEGKTREFITEVTGHAGTA
jgi:hypothetical protein